MNIQIPTGIKHMMETEVSEKQSAISIGSGSLAVFATPVMIALLETTAHESIQALLPEGFTSVGSEVNIKHLKATAIGMKVKSESYLKSVNGPRLYFELHAWDEKGLIGIGTHTRVIVEEKIFMDKLK